MGGRGGGGGSWAQWVPTPPIGSLGPSPLKLYFFVFSETYLVFNLFVSDPSQMFHFSTFGKHLDWYNITKIKTKLEISLDSPK